MRHRESVAAPTAESAGSVAGAPAAVGNDDVSAPAGAAAHMSERGRGWHWEQRDSHKEHDGPNGHRDYDRRRNAALENAFHFADILQLNMQTVKGAPQNTKTAGQRTATAQRKMERERV